VQLARLVIGVLKRREFENKQQNTIGIALEKVFEKIISCLTFQGHNRLL